MGSFEGEKMSRPVYVWVCPNCDSQVHHKGLCRDCTEYDESGGVLKPIQRIKCDENGNELIRTPTTLHIPSPSLMEFKVKRQRKLTKNQKAALKEEMKKQAEARKIALEAEQSETGLVELGESEEEWVENTKLDST